MCNDISITNVYIWYIPIDIPIRPIHVLFYRYAIIINNMFYIVEDLRVQMYQ